MQKRAEMIASCFALQKGLHDKSRSTSKVYRDLFGGIMSRAAPILLLVVGLPVSLLAQAIPSMASKDTNPTASAPPSTNDSSSAPGSSTISSGDASAPEAPTQQAKSPNPSKAKPSKPKPSPDLDRPPME